MMLYILLILLHFDLLLRRWASFGSTLSSLDEHGLVYAAGLVSFPPSEVGILLLPPTALPPIPYATHPLDLTSTSPPSSFNSPRPLCPAVARHPSTTCNKC